MDKNEIKAFGGQLENLKSNSNCNPNILNIYGYLEDEERFYIITEARKVDERVEL